MLLCQLIGIGTRLVIHIAVKHPLRTIPLRAVHLDQRRRRRHHDHRLNPIALSRIRHALRMIAGRGCDQPFRPLLLRQCTDLIIGAPQLIGARQLHIFWFQIHLISSLCTEMITVHQFRLRSHLPDDLIRLLKLIKRQFLHLLSPAPFIHRKQRIHKLVCVKLLQIFYRLPYTNVFDRHLQL